MAGYLLTGGAGFIGSNIVEALLKRGEAVRVLDDFSTSDPGNLAPLLMGRRLELIDGDIRDLETCRRAAGGMDFVLHQAALGSVPRSVADPLTTDAVNVRGTLNVLLAARDAKVRRFVYASSSSIYGDQPLPPGQAGPLPKVETMPPRPLSPYAVSKLAAESYCKVFYHAYGLETVCLRYFNIFGPRQDPESRYAAVVPKFATALRDGIPATIYGDGGQSRDFTFVANAVSANLLACEAAEAAGEVFNIGCGTSFSVRALLSTLEDISGRRAEVDMQPPRSGDVRDSMADIAKARRLLGYEPMVGFRQGLEATWAWYAARPLG
ncbi:MAG: SDR family oxidoreductase [Pseudomonadota bacterium]